ncbi:15961_t:CDS:1, partial [Gigaspora margarita]
FLKINGIEELPGDIEPINETYLAKSCYVKEVGIRRNKNRAIQVEKKLSMTYPQYTENNYLDG